MSASILLLLRSGLLILFIDWCVVAVFSVSPSSFIQLRPSSGCCYVRLDQVAMSASILLLLRSGLLILFIDWCVVAVFSVSPSSFIQLRPSSGCICFVVISSSSCFNLPSISMFATVLPSNFILLSFTSR